MIITILHVDSCPHWTIVEERIREITAERADISIAHHLVESAEEAHNLGFHGSPSILVDGVDVFADATAHVGLACRIYQTPDGPAGAPTIDQLRVALDQV